MNNKRRSPDTYKPGLADVIWLIAESPRQVCVLGVEHGVASAEEVAAALWPNDPNEELHYDDDVAGMNGLTTSRWVTSILGQAVHDGRIAENDGRFVASMSLAKRLANEESLRIGCGRPYLLPRWPFT